MNDDYKMMTLQRIADTLGFSIDLFLADGTVTESSEVFKTVSEDIEVLRLLKNIKEPALRLSCLNFLREAASKNTIA